MNLTVPIVGVETGPTWASDLNTSLGLIDSHNHSSGNGVQITPSGLNINSDLSLQSNNLTLSKSVRFSVQSSALNSAADLACIYSLNGNLYYNNATGTPVQITNGSAVSGTPGSIGNLVSPASVNYVSLNSTYVFQSAANTPGTLDAGNVIVRNVSAASYGITLAPPSSIAANSSLVLPIPPASTSIVTLDSSGNMNANYTLDNTSITQASGVISVITPFILPVGSVIDFAGNLAPTNFLICDGSSLLRSAYPALFAVIGTTFGSVDSTHFNLPNLGGRVTVGVGNSGGSTFTLSNTGGEETHTLSIAEMPSHNHSSPAQVGASKYTSGSDSLFAPAAYGGTTGNQGGGGAHNNMQPYMALNKIIKYQ